MCCINSCTSPLGTKVNPNFDNYYYSVDGKEILYCVNDSWEFFEVIKMNADYATFEVISSSFSKDKNSLFYYEITVHDSILDRDSFYTKKGKNYNISYLGFDKNGVYVFSGSNIPKKIKYADPKTYKLLSYNRVWAKDNNHYYYNDSCVDIDYPSFKIINSNFSVDNNTAYYNTGNQFKPINVDITTFKEMSFNPHTTGYSCCYDKNYLYYHLRNEYNGGYVDEMIKAPYLNLNTIKIIAGKYLKIDNALYYGKNKIKGIDTDSLIVAGYYIKSKNIVIYEGNKTNDIDANSIEYIDLYNEYIRDKNYLFFKGKKVKDIDIKTIKFINRSYVKDKKHVFYEGIIIPKANGATFRLDAKGNYRDNKYCYFNERIIGVIDSITGKIN